MVRCPHCGEVDHDSHCVVWFNENRSLRPIPTYARVNGPPATWRDLDCYLNGEYYALAHEVNTQEGWAMVWNSQGQLERLEGNWELRWRSPRRP